MSGKMALGPVLTFAAPAGRSAGMQIKSAGHGGTVVVADNGVGMTATDLRNWATYHLGMDRRCAARPPTRPTVPSCAPLVVTQATVATGSPQFQSYLRTTFTTTCPAASACTASAQSKPASSSATAFECVKSRRLNANYFFESS